LIDKLCLDLDVPLGLLGFEDQYEILVNLLHLCLPTF